MFRHLPDLGKAAAISVGIVGFWFAIPVVIAMAIPTLVFLIVYAIIKDTKNYHNDR